MISAEGFWLAQLALPLLLARHIARTAERKERSGAAAAILLLTFVHGWAAGGGVGDAFLLNENARRVLALIFWATGILWGSFWNYAIVACWAGRSPRA